MPYSIRLVILLEWFWKYQTCLYWYIFTQEFGSLNFLRIIDSVIKKDFLFLTTLKSYLWCRYHRILMRSLLHHHPVGRHFVVSQIFEKLQITGLLITLMVYLCFQSFSFNCRSFGSCMKFVGLLTVLLGLPKFCSSYTQFFLAVLSCYPSSINRALWTFKPYFIISWQ